MAKLSRRVFALLVKALASSVVLFILAQYYSCNNSGITSPDGSDTTSHNFTWQIDTLGDGGSSVLYDVAIINDTLAYAVGEIYKRDSVGNWEPTPYGLAIWNGTNWTLRKLFAQYPGVPSPSLVRPHGIFAFSQTNIWFADADVFWWDGQSQLLRVHQVVNTVLSAGQYVDKLWGSSPSDIYAVGINGAIAHYDGARWRRIESGTTVNIQDIWGASFDTRGIHLQTILAVASNRSAVPQGRNVLSIQGTRVALIDDNGLAMDLSAVWFIPGWKYFLTGSGVYISPDGTNWRRDTSQPSFYANAIRGQAANDIMIAGSYGVISHYNGSRWTHYLGGQLQQFFGEYKAVAIKGNLVIAVGWKEDKAILLTGRR